MGARASIETPSPPWRQWLLRDGGQLGAFLESFRLVGGFPSEGVLRSGRNGRTRRSCDRSGRRSFRVSIMPFGVSWKLARTSSTRRSASTLPVPKRIHHHGNRLGHADRVGQLHFAARRQAGRHDVLRNVARHVAGRAVHLRRILARERAAAVPAHAAVGVDDDLAARETGVAVRSADDESAGGIDVILGAANPPCCEGTTGSMMCFFTSARSCSVVTSSSCCVEITTASMRLGLLPTYSTLTWLLPSGRR